MPAMSGSDTVLNWKFIDIGLQVCLSTRTMKKVRSDIQFYDGGKADQFWPARDAALAYYIATVLAHHTCVTCCIKLPIAIYKRNNREMK